MTDNRFRPTFFSDVLKGNSAAFTVRTEAVLAEKFFDGAVVPCQYLSVAHFARLGHCELQAAACPKPQFYRYWGGEDNDRLCTSYEQVAWEINWQDHDLLLVRLAWATACGTEQRDWVIAETQEIAESFILDVERKTHEPGEAILVFSEGYWDRSESLYEATQSASFDDLILADNLKQTIRDDFARFLASESHYDQLQIAWRRGALLVGPPGNGKTHCVRALVNELGVSCLYVQSLSHHHYTPEQMWHQVFDRARGLRPCILVLEDLDALVNDENRSFFLNQLDGFQRNHGLILLATTNHPERIDAAIIDRPSRFDRKYHFPLPAPREREDYLRSWQQRLAGETNWSDNSFARVVAQTEGFSFAYLKELVISTLMAWMHHREIPLEQVMRQQAQLLRKQMRTERESSAAATNHDSCRESDTAAVSV